MRCQYIDNTYKGIYGTCYMRAPEAINYNRKCPWYKEKKDAVQIRETASVDVGKQA